MATLGAANNANTSTVRDDSSYTLMSAITLPAGTWQLDSVHIYNGQHLDYSNPNYSVAVYQGGSLSDINGAVRIFAAQDLVPPAVDQWNTVTAGSESLTGGSVIWLCMSSDGATDNWDVGSGDSGDFSTNLYLRRWDTNYVTTPYPTPTAPAISGTQTDFSVVKMYITYSAAGGTAKNLLLRHYEG